MKMMKRNIAILFISVLSFNALAGTDMASDRISDIRNTKHNFAPDDVVQLPNGATRDIVSSENQVCIFCHTPHGDPNKAAKVFLWNRADSADMTAKYDSSTLNIDNTSVALGSKSRMCLSCHDGTVAIGSVDMNASASDGTTTVPTPITMTSAAGNVDSAGNLTGGNSFLGSDFSNDHPVGFLYDGALAGLDSDLIDPTSVAYIGVRAGQRVAGYNQSVVDAGGGGSAGVNDPTVAVTRISVPLEVSVPVIDGATGFVSVANSGRVECTTCHDPHIRSTNVDENIKFLRLHRFQKADPTLGTFDINSDINCLACHKNDNWVGSAHATEIDAPHAFTPAEAIVREIPADTAVWQASCLSCHDTHTVSGSRWLLRSAGDSNADLSDVDQSCFKCHTVSSGVLDEASGTVADIESISIAGGHAAANTSFSFVADDTAHWPTDSVLSESSANLQIRHATCSDCHNPHRLTKGLHVNNGLATNHLVSGALTGISGLDALDGGGLFLPYGDEGIANPIVATKEHQICFKCHSSYGHGTDIGIAQFSNTVMEFSPNAASAHPVVNGGNNTSIATIGLMEAPFDTGVNTQTMYCSDCHTNTDNSAIKNGSGSPVGAKGSHNGDVATCETCHVSAQYNYDATVASVVTSGFACGSLLPADCGAANSEGYANNLHIFHAKQAGGQNICSNCHVKVPHGWKNKALLANINDADSNDTRYYGLVTDVDGAKSKIDVMSASGDWSKVNCGTAGGCHIPP